MRVLRPVVGSKGRAGTPGEETAPKLEPLVDEAADANAIEVSIPCRKSLLDMYCISLLLLGKDTEKSKMTIPVYWDI